jgi:sarcosine oxidase subunit delta
MLLITCPICGVTGNETDFHYGGEAHISRPASHDPAAVTDEAQRDYLYVRRNAKGIHFERWRCDRGCGKWFQAARDTLTMRFLATYRVGDWPPSDITALVPPGNPWHGVFHPASSGKAGAQDDLGRDGGAA